MKENNNNQPMPDPFNQMAGKIAAQLPIAKRACQLAGQGRHYQEGTQTRQRGSTGRGGLHSSMGQGRGTGGVLLQDQPTPGRT